MADITLLRKVLSECRVVAMVGLSDKPHRPSYFVGKYLQEHGFQRFMIVNGHGGNKHFINYFLEMLRDKPKNYTVTNIFPAAIKHSEQDNFLDAEIDGHGGEVETSMMAHFYPELVKSMQPASYGLPLKRLEKYSQRGIDCALQWYSNFPGHLCADSTLATTEKGKQLANLRISHLVDVIKFLKNDDTLEALQKKFLQQIMKPTIKNTEI